MPRNDVDHQRLQVAGADADQGLRAAARAERHADAEQEAADDVGQPGEVRPGVDRLGEVDDAGEVQRARAEQRHRDGEQPHAHAAGVAHVDPVGHRAHGAEVGLVADRAEDEGEHEGPAGDVRSDAAGRSTLGERGEALLRARRRRCCPGTWRSALPASSAPRAVAHRFLRARDATASRRAPSGSRARRRAACAAPRSRSCSRAARSAPCRSSTARWPRAC